MSTQDQTFANNADTADSFHVVKGRSNRHYLMFMQKMNPLRWSFVVLIFDPSKFIRQQGNVQTSRLVGAAQQVNGDKDPWAQEELSLIAELKFLVAQLKGGDKRLLRHDAPEHTHGARNKEGTCDKLHHSLSILVDEESYASDDTKYLICELATLCITDHPIYRNEFASVDKIHDNVINLVASMNPKVSAKAAHLMYIATFGNSLNHQLFVSKGAIPALSAIVKNYQSAALQVMYALAALQNLAASYCEFNFHDEETKVPASSAESCSWGWRLNQEHIGMILEDEDVLISDGSVARQRISADTDLMAIVKELVCEGPVEGEPSEDNIFPGLNAISTGRDDRNLAIVPWAATGLLKNLALEPAAKSAVEKSLDCLCYMAESPDWLESSKAQATLYHLRREKDPCWFDAENEDRLDCIDKNFLDDGYSTCEDFSNAISEDCDNRMDLFTGVTARQACCECGGGYQLLFEALLHDEL